MRSIESLALSILRLVEEEAMKEFTGQVGFYDGGSKKVGPMLVGTGWTAHLGLVAQMLSVELGPSYGRVAPRTQWFWGLTRLRRHAFPDDRTARADLDEDGTVDEGEQLASDRAVFF